jgi:hypothetical protein
MTKLTKWIVLAACVTAAPAYAQIKSPPATAPAAASGSELSTPVPAQTPPADLSQRLALARKINEITPIKGQIEAGVDHAAQRIPATKRETFKSRVMGAIDEQKLEESSINAMAQTFTLPELQRMYDYYSTPEAHAIAEKWPIYRQLVQPEIVRMMDKAMMEARTGGPGDAPAAEPAAAATPPAYPHSTTPAKK